MLAEEELNEKQAHARACPISLAQAAFISGASAADDASDGASDAHDASPPRW
jgi:hypothetical protein